MSIPVNSSCVAVPDINEDFWDRETSGDIEILDLEVKRNSRLSLSDIFANLLASNIIWAISDFRSQDARSIGAEDGGIGGCTGVINFASLVVINILVDCKGCEITVVLLGS